MAGHEYSVVGHSRSRIGSYIAVVSGAVAGALTTVAGLLAAYLESNGMLNVPGLILWPITGGLVFAGLFVFFDRFIWKWTKVRAILGVPDISGTWKVSGRSFRVAGIQDLWEARMEITQGYEKITVWVKTEQSESTSISAAIVNEGRPGYRLIYSYRNQPRPGEVGLVAHLGHCELLFDPNGISAAGTYFNGIGRASHGTMALSKEC